MTNLYCARCDHTWVQRGLRLPLQCPNCHSPRWHHAREVINPVKIIPEAKFRRVARNVLRKYREVFERLADA